MEKGELKNKKVERALITKDSKFKML